MQTTCVIIDDEPLAIELIEDHIAQLDYLKVAGTFRNAVNALDFLKRNKVDLLFLDIQMPMLSGIDFLKSANLGPKVILTTAYREYALEGYELNVIDYLLKPITFDRFFKAVNKYFTLHSTLPQQTKGADIRPSNDFIYVKADKKNVKVLFSDILYIESIRDYSKIHTLGHTLIVKEKISSFESLLPEHYFLRVHRSYLVNLEKITAYTNHDVEVNAIEIPIGGLYKQQVLKALCG